GLGVPQFYASRPVPRRQVSPVPTERHADPMLVVSSEGVQDLTGLPVPDRHIAGTSRRELSAVARIERRGMRGEREVNAIARAGEHLLAGRQVPDLHLPVRADGGQVLALGVEGDAAGKAAMRLFESLDHPARLDVPDLDGPVPAR